MTTILLVDDNREGADAVAALLQASDHAVHSAYSVREALDALDEQKFDIVVSDIRMP
jgi:CheY-like chemotaxis protein